MKLVNRLVELTSGDVRIDGQSVDSLDETELRRGIGYVIQQVGLFPHMTVAENVATVPKLLGWSKQEISPARGRAARPRRPARDATTAPATPRSSPAASASASASRARSPPTRR